MRRIKWKWALWMLLLLPVAALANSNKNIEKKLIESMGQNHIHNLSVGIIQSGKLTYLADLHLSESSGIAQSAGIAQPAGSALFRVASITKLFTGQAILQLAEKGKLSLDDKVERYIPELKNTEISIRQLLTHHASLQACKPASLQACKPASLQACKTGSGRKLLITTAVLTPI